MAGVTSKADVVVVGGGSAGVAAALGAARQGAHVVLLERYGFLGGTMTAVTLGSICGYYTVDGDTATPVVGGVVDDVLARLEDLGGRGEPLHWLETASVPYDVFAMKVALDRLVTDAGVEVSCHTLVTDVVRDGSGAVQGVEAHTRGGPRTFLGRTVVDCSGDAEVLAAAGGAFDLDHSTLQFPTTMFRFAGVDVDRMRRITRPELHAHLEQAVAAGLDLPRTAGGMYALRPGIVHVNITRITDDGRPPDPFDPHALTRAEMAGREQVLAYEQAFRRFVPGFERAFVLDSGPQIGFRESRRMVGRYVLTVDDVLGEGRFDDAIACSAWPVEDHGADRSTVWRWLRPGAYYQIPYRVMLPREVGGLLVAGRCASATHEAQASLRVSAQCFAMGQAAGTAAALASASGVEPADVAPDHLQDRLRAAGAVLGEVPDRSGATG